VLGISDFSFWTFGIPPIDTLWHAPSRSHVQACFFEFRLQVLRSQGVAPVFFE